LEDYVVADLIRHLALVSESSKVTSSEVSIVAAALQKQVIRDLTPHWGIRATVQAFARLKHVPLDYWPMIVRDDIKFDAAGIHLDNDGQPYALITASDNNNVWSLTASHECLEMLVDPMGDRLVAGDSPKKSQNRVQFLVEVCDPSEAASFGYSVNGVLVSDFYTPHYFDPVAATGVRYSFTGAVQRPRQVLRGGYLSWLDPVTREWWQEIWFSGSKSQFVNLGKLTAAKGSIRSQIDAINGKETYKAMSSGWKKAVLAGLPASENAPGELRRAKAIHAQIASISGQKPKKQDDDDESDSYNDRDEDDRRVCPRFGRRKDDEDDDDET
jgi:hypothetical protein